ncbi:MAG TPA: FHA domain-containing protein [Vicinamibacterales bacterium]|nr:FHA domain-containing protein [Vicinamibacterales bacterium]
MAPRLDLIVRNTDRVISMVPGQTLIAGRTAQCDLQLDDPSVSRRHCSITYTDSGILQVKDLDSANGTFVNERQVKEATARPGDLVRLGAAIIEIPFLGRLLCVADFYDALTSARAYRDAMTADEAIRMIEKGAGHHFDPAVAAALVRLSERGELNVDAMPSQIMDMLSVKAVP